ncbi:MAG: RNase adapter RapZ [Pseudomonadota bacterium]
MSADPTTESETAFTESGDAPIPVRRPSPLVLIVTGMSGAGRTSTIKALEDMGYEVLDNLPLPLFERVIEPVADTHAPIAVGVDTRTRGFSARALTETVATLRGAWRTGTVLIFLDCDDEVLVSRFSETRRRHPLAPAEDPATGISRERDLLAPVRETADAVIDTTQMTPHELKAEIASRFTLNQSAGLSVTVQSFSYKTGTPSSADMVLDCRFLRNPYWEEDLRALDGRDERIQGFVGDDPRYAAFFDKLCEMVLMLLPAYKAEGKAYFTIALGCTGGRHRSVTVAEALAEQVRGDGWPVSLRHRELERKGRSA